MQNFIFYKFLEILRCQKDFFAKKPPDRELKFRFKDAGKPFSDSDTSILEKFNSESPILKVYNSMMKFIIFEWNCSLTLILIAYSELTTLKTYIQFTRISILFASNMLWAQSIPAANKNWQSRVPQLRKIFFKPYLKIVEAKFASSVNCKIEF
jgi:hypothetical protein